MKRELIKFDYYGAYYYANIVNNLLRDQWGYLRTIHDLFENDGHLNFTEPFPKYSALHRFITFCIHLDFADNQDVAGLQRKMAKEDPVLSVNHALKHYNIPHTTFKEWLHEREGPDDTEQASEVGIEHFVSDYLEDLQWEEAYHTLLTRIADEVFFVMFNNRTILYLLNDLIASYISDVVISELDAPSRKEFSRDGMLKRHSIPEWVKKSVFYRDRGICTSCNKDVSGTLSISNEKHFDHIVPLAQGGINDVTNLQLLCETCNLSYGKKQKVPSNNYERWYPTQ